MKEIIKASVAGYSFTFEKEAHAYLENYLNDIETHFASKEDGKEIVGDIEQRLSELLRMDIGEADKVVTLANVKHLVEIMGKPSDLAGDENENNSQTERTARESVKTETSSFQKRIYRDEDSAILGGVLSGLGNYFQIDRVLLRIGFVILLVFGHQFLHEIGNALVLAYIIAWIVIPKAKTIQEKLAMSGKDPSIADIETGNAQSLIKPTSNAGRVIVRVLKVLCLVILALAIAGLISVLIFGFFFPSIFSFPSVFEFLKIIDFSSPDMIGVITLVSLLPLGAMIYVAVRLISGFKKRDGMMLGVTFVIWVALCSYLCMVGVKYATNYKQFGRDTDEYVVNSSSDTVHVRLADEFRNATDFQWGKHSDHSNEMLKQIDSERKAWFLMPRIDLKEDSTVNAVKIEIHKKAYASSLGLANEKVDKSNFGVQLHDSLVLLKPHVYSTENHWDRELFDVTVVYPKGKTVILDDRLKESTDEDWNFDID